MSIVYYGYVTKYDKYKLYVIEGYLYDEPYKTHAVALKYSSSCNEQSFESLWQYALEKIPIVLGRSYGI